MQEAEEASSHRQLCKAKVREPVQHGLTAGTTSLPKPSPATIGGGSPAPRPLQRGMCPSLTRTFSLPQARNFSDILGWEGRCGRTAGVEINVWAFNLSFSENSDQFTSRSFWGPNFNWEENSDTRENSFLTKYSQRK